MDLRNKSVLLTGAARGIGKAIAEELATAGCDILGVDLRVADMSETNSAVTERGRRFAAYACDISDLEAVQRLPDQLGLPNTQVDILVNNAGVMTSGPFLDREFLSWTKGMQVNLIGLMALTHAILPHLLDKNSGHIVNIASVAGKFGTEGVAAYAAAKHGVVGFSSALREELRDHNIGVSWICPSMVDTRMAEGVRRHFLTPLVQPEQVARAVRKAIERNASEVFVPSRVRFNVSILPSLAPDLARVISRITKASRGWLDAKKDVEARAESEQPKAMTGE